MNRKTFPDFGKELQRPFDVHENCYDCAGFYDGCTAWPAAQDFTCGKFNRLPDVMPGTCGQRFPATSRKLAGSPYQDRDTQDKPAQAKRHPARSLSPHVPYPVSIPGPDGERRCGCGAILPKRKRCCAECRAKRKRQATESFKGRLVAVVAGSGVARKALPVASIGPGASENR